MYLETILGDAYHENMSIEEISKALESQKIGQDSETEKLKKQLSEIRTKSENYQKQLKAKRTDEEQKAAEQKEMIDRIMQENADLKRSAALSDNTAKLISIGYDADLAAETAIAVVDNDTEKMFANHAKFLENYKKTIQQDLLKSTPKPVRGADSGTDYQKLIDESKGNSDSLAAVYYTRVQQQNQNLN